MMLRLSDPNGTVINPEKAGFILQNLTWNQPNRAGGGGEEVSFALLYTEHYSLRLRGREVWSYGKTPIMAGLSPVSDTLYFTCTIHILKDITVP
jgi:hypothetical protein